MIGPVEIRVVALIAEKIDSINIKKENNNMNFSKELKTEKEAKNFMRELYENGLLFHFDDDPRDILCKDDLDCFELLFKDEEECKLLDQRVSECFYTIEDPHLYALELISDLRT